MRARPITAFALVAALGSALAACKKQTPEPHDARVQTLDPLAAVKESDSIVLARPLSHRDIRELSMPRQRGLPPLRLEETETTLRVLRVIKGPALPAEIRFHFYDARGYAAFGPLTGPGPLGSSGIFFLKQQVSGFRAFVDVYRPDIATPWLVGPVDSEPCASPAKCIAELLLSYRGSDDPRVFSGSLPLGNVGTSELLTGFLTTFDLLSELATDPQHPDAVRRGACLELAGWYALELSQACTSLIAGTPSATEYVRVAANLRESLRKGGIAWARRHIRSNDEDDLRRYIGLLLKSPDRETREVAESLRDERR